MAQASTMSLTQSSSGKEHKYSIGDLNHTKHAQNGYHQIRKFAWGRIKSIIKYPNPIQQGRYSQDGY
ncbi:Tfp pilus assembly protein PilX [Pantoea coffeiphila]|nr:Tfp pilus assembly protein PilX [Pantoea coffeiphila]